jgi:hypothetical protein
MSFCPVESDLNRHLTKMDAAEAKEGRMKIWLKESGRVVDYTEQSMREDGDFETFANEHTDGYALVQLGLVALGLYPRGYDDSYLKQLAGGVVSDYIQHEYAEVEEYLIAKEWGNFE